MGLPGRNCDEKQVFFIHEAVRHSTLWCTVRQKEGHVLSREIPPLLLLRIPLRSSQYSNFHGGFLEYHLIYCVIINFCWKRGGGVQCDPGAKHNSQIIVGEA